jgi:hypothetical protein
MYNTLSASEAKSCGVSLEDNTNNEMEELEAEAHDDDFDRKLKYEMVKKRWVYLYDKQGS